MNQHGGGSRGRWRMTEIPKQRLLNRILGDQLDIWIFSGAAVLAVPFLVLGFFAPETLGRLSTAALNHLTGWWSWFYLISCSFFVLVSILVVLSPLGRIRLGPDHQKPEFSFFSWFSMLFSAGMGIGLVFWGSAEPLYHYMSPPVGEGRTAESARLAFEIFFFHWGVHAWGTYVVVALSMSYCIFRKGRMAIVSSCLNPLFGDRVSESAGGKLVDVMAIWATVMGVVTSLGMGALQINSGLGHSIGMPSGAGTASMIIIVITFLFLLSTISGVNKGIKFLSQINAGLMVLMVIFFYTLGPFKLKFLPQFIP